MWCGVRGMEGKDKRVWNGYAFLKSSKKKGERKNLVKMSRSVTLLSSPLTRRDGGASKELNSYTFYSKNKKNNGEKVNKMNLSLSRLVTFK